MLMGDDTGPILFPLPARSSNKGKVESSAVDSSSVESIYELVPPANTSFTLLGQCDRFSFSFPSGRRRYRSKTRGVPIGVVSAVEEGPASFAIGEKCKGGGDSRGSSFTVALRVFWGGAKTGMVMGIECMEYLQVQIDETVKGRVESMRRDRIWWVQQLLMMMMMMI